MSLKIKGDEQHGLYHLYLLQRATDGNNRLIGEDGGAFLNAPNIATELEIPQKIEEFLREAALFTEVLDVLLSKRKAINKFDDLLQAGIDGKATVFRHTAEKDIEYGDLLLDTCMEVPIHHGILIIVGKQGQVAFTGDIIAHNSKTSFLPLIYVVLTDSAAPCGTVRGPVRCR